MYGFGYVFRIWSTQRYVWALILHNFPGIFLLCWDLGQFFIEKEKFIYLLSHPGYASNYLHRNLVTQWHLYTQHWWNSYNVRTNSNHCCKTSLFHQRQGQHFTCYADDLHLLKHDQSVDYYKMKYSVLKCLTKFLTAYL